MASWRSIHLPQDNLPHLLVKARLDSTGYTIHLTDLSRIWSETLTKREIERRAIKEDCSIDPGEDDQQYSILLDKLRSTLTRQDDTTLTLKPAQQDEGLLLHLSAPLPQPLQPLKWTIHLALQPQPQIATQLIHPLILLCQTQQSQTQHLIHELSEKDRIIAKLTDRLETSGNDLTTVFPGVSHVKLSRKKTQREQLARYVGALGDFDEEGWRAREKDAKQEDGAGGVGLEAMDAVLGELPEVVTGREAEDTREWWRELDDGRTSQKTDSRRADTTNGNATQGNAKPNPAPPADAGHEMPNTNNDSFDADFQRQGTPPHLKQGNSRPSLAISNPCSTSSPAPPPARVQPEDESTEDESDLDAPIKQARPAQTPSHSSMPTRRRSVTPDVPLPRSSASERHKQPSPPPVPSPQPAPKSRGKLGAIGGKKPNTPTTPSPAPEAEPESEMMEVDPRPAPGKARTKLGNIGGKSKPSPTPPSAEEPVATSTTASSAKRYGLGTIGGKKTGRPTSAAATDSIPSRQASETLSASASVSATTPATKPTAIERKSRAPERREATKEPTPPRESSQERADRKRNELKRQLDERAKVPVKKKRKF
ncbi:hypothetical protein LTR86_008691 [Recurvomyces mirabilis]|nr:hypothetical protein LTR86_008691 [Recurvomyces mirabilis]